MNRVLVWLMFLCAWLGVQSLTVEALAQVVVPTTRDVLIGGQSNCLGTQAPPAGATVPLGVTIIRNGIVYVEGGPMPSTQGPELGMAACYANYGVTARIVERCVNGILVGSWVTGNTCGAATGSCLENAISDFAALSDVPDLVFYVGQEQEANQSTITVAGSLAERFFGPAPEMVDHDGNSATPTIMMDMSLVARMRAAWGDPGILLAELRTDAGEEPAAGIPAGTTYKFREYTRASMLFACAQSLPWGRCSVLRTSMFHMADSVHYSAGVPLDGAGLPILPPVPPDQDYPTVPGGQYDLGWRACEADILRKLGNP